MNRVIRIFTVALMLAGLQTEALAGFTTIDFPGALNTLPGGINDSGQIVGQFDAPLHGFIYTSGQFSPLGTDGTTASGINNVGQVVGRFAGANGAVVGFLKT